jgi:hypothetical protein
MNECKPLPSLALRNASPVMQSTGLCSIPASHSGYAASPSARDQPARQGDNVLTPNLIGRSAQNPISQRCLSIPDPARVSRLLGVRDTGFKARARCLPVLHAKASLSFTTS